MRRSGGGFLVIGGGFGCWRGRGSGLVVGTCVRTRGCVSASFFAKATSNIFFCGPCGKTAFPLAAKVGT